MISIRLFDETKDREWVEQSMEIFQDGLVALDDRNILHRETGYGKGYTAYVRVCMSKEHGAFFVAEVNNKQVGFIVGIVHTLDEGEKLSSREVVYGQVIELFVIEEYRGKNVAQKLMEKMESYFKKQGCKNSYIEVFGPNARAKSFYEKVGYGVRDYTMMKML